MTCAAVRASSLKGTLATGGVKENYHHRWWSIGYTTFSQWSKRTPHQLLVK